MADGFVVRPELLAGPAAVFDTSAELLRAAVAQARADLAGLGDVCGDDDQGRAFAARYDPVVAQGLDAVGRSVDVVASFGEGMRAASAQYVIDDDGVSAGFDPGRLP